MTDAKQPLGSTEKKEDSWPALPLEAWQETCETLHRWFQIVGKIRLKLAPMTNHWWHVSFSVTSRGLTTSPMPYGSRVCQIDFDFISHEMLITTGSGDTRAIALKPRSVADFYGETMAALTSLGMTVGIWTTPVEIAERTPFEQDRAHASYDPEYAHRFWKVLVQTDRVQKAFRGRFIGKASPVQFFWGSFDMAATRFSGRPAPEHPGGPNVARSVMVEAYSHEVSSCGFWPGAGLGKPAFYAYAYPEPEGFREHLVEPAEASYNRDFGEFILPYDAVRTAPSPDEKLLSFFESTYEAAAIHGKWDRASLERGGDEHCDTPVKYHQDL
jgi:hypothetical protein